MTPMIRSIVFPENWQHLDDQLQSFWRLPLSYRHQQNRVSFIFIPNHAGLDLMSYIFDEIPNASET